MDVGGCPRRWALPRPLAVVGSTACPAAALTLLVHLFVSGLNPNPLDVVPLRANEVAIVDGCPVAGVFICTIASTNSAPSSSSQTDSRPQRLV